MCVNVHVCGSCVCVCVYAKANIHKHTPRSSQTPTPTPTPTENPTNMLEDTLSMNVVRELLVDSVYGLAGVYLVAAVVCCVSAVVLC